MAKDDGGIRFKFSNKGGARAIKEKIQEKFDRAKGEVADKVQKNFGKGFVRSDMFESGLVFKNHNKMLSGGVAPGNDAYRKEIAEIYVDAWEKRYEAFVAEHKKKSKTFESSGSGLTPHQKYKKKNLGKPAYHTNRDVKYVEHTRWTGLMYESIMEAFEDGGNKHLSVPNLLIAGGFRLNKQNFDKHYFKYFTPWFRKKGILKNNEDIVELSPSQWSDVVDMMTAFVKKGFVGPLVEVLNKLELRV